MKKKDHLFEILKKQKQYNLQSYLETNDLIALSLTSKKYYMQMYPLISALKLDEQKVFEKRAKNKNKTQKANKDIIENNSIQINNLEQEVQVDIEKVSISKFEKKIKQFNQKEWQKIEELDIKNSFLQKKMQSKVFIFYKNEKTNEVIYVNRSLIDPQLNLNKQNMQDNYDKNKLYEDMYSEGSFNEIDFSTPQNIKKRQAQILNSIEIKKETQKKKQSINYSEELAKTLKMNKVAIILCFGGSFSFGIFQNAKCILHKSDKKYVCRKKAGERQFNKDKQSGTSISSMGSQIRRDQQKRHVINVSQILQQHKKDLGECDLILLQAPGLNRLYVINEDQNLDGLQNKLRSICLTAKKANFTEIESIYSAISIINMVKIKKASNQQEQKNNNTSKKAKEEKKI